MSQSPYGSGLAGLPHKRGQILREETRVSSQIWSKAPVPRAQEVCDFSGCGYVITSHHPSPEGRQVMPQMNCLYPWQFFFLNFFFYFMCMNVLPAYMFLFTKIRRRRQIPRTAVMEGSVHHADAGNGVQSSARAANSLNPRAVSAAPSSAFFFK